MQRVGVTALIVVGAAFVAMSALIHLHLWLVGYRHIPRIGPLFLAQSVGGLLLAVTIVLFRRLLVVLAGALYMAATIAGLALSATVGFLGFHDDLSVPWARTSLVIEIVGLVLLAGAGAALAVARDST